MGRSVCGRWPARSYSPCLLWCPGPAERQRMRRGTDLCLAVSADSSGGLVLESADDRGENGPRHATSGDLADDAADIRCRSAVGEQRQQHAEDLSPDAAADGAGDSISDCPEFDVLRRARRDISTDSAADDLDDQIDEQSR